MTDEMLMRQAIAQARLALAMDEVPIGCVIFHQPSNQVIAAAHNLREFAHDPTAHAEILALRQAGEKLGQWQLNDCTLAVTVEPCPMCAGALVNARISRLIYGCPDPKAGAVRTLFSLCDDARLNHRVEITTGILGEECAALLREFFQAQRAAGKK
ncbi:MAG: tRNA adenosine(34) deaminase TadA [Tepidisphaeraceae bacterium]|jgi:tRNA(adenine34) deaminase